MQYQFLLESLRSSDRITQTLARQGIKTDDVHFVSENKSDFSGHCVREASIFEERDVFHSGVRMAILGIAVAASVSAAVTVVQPYGWQPTLINYFFFCLLFGGFGAWIGGLSGISHRNYRLNEYQHELEEGHALMLVYTDEAHEQSMRNALATDFPDVQYLRKMSHYDNPLIKAKTVELDH